ncbi:MAG: polyprenyl synthetase family protein [Opitutales bacterium]
MADNQLEVFVKSMQDKIASLKTMLKGQAKSFNVELRKFMKDSIDVDGKCLRPMLVFSAAFDQEFNDAVRERATCVELIHLASLIHDDIIDKAQIRRGKPTVSKKYGLKEAVLIGDVLFSHALTILTKHSHTALVKTLKTVKDLSEGELIQNLLNANKEVGLKEYFKIIENKTAILFALSCYLGASVSGDEDWAICAEEAGLEMGIAYQIYDDICDWTLSTKESGKTVGTDLVSGKKTLPIFMLENCLDRKSKAKLLEFIEAKDDKSILAMMEENNVFELCHQEKDKYLAKAKKLLQKFDNGASQKLIEFCDAIESMR